MYRKTRVRFKILRNGAEYAEIYAKETPTLRMSRSSDIKMSMQGVFLPVAVNARGETVDINWLSDEIQPVLIIDDEEYPLAVLMPAAVVPHRKSSEEEVSVELYDRCWRLSDTKTETLLHFNAGTNYLMAIEGLLTQAGIAVVIKTPTSLALAEDREDWNIGTSYLTIINQLLSEINYENLWFNENGFAMLHPSKALTAENIKRIYTDKKVDPRDRRQVKITSIFPEIQQKNDIYKSPNVFVCVCSNADKSGDMVARSENTNPQSPLSIPSRGRRIMQVVKVNNIASQQALQEYADKLRNESLITGESYTFQTLLLPECGVADIVALQVGDSNSICVEEGWQMTLGVGGTMSHNLKKAVINIG